MQHTDTDSLIIRIGMDSLTVLTNDGQQTTMDMKSGISISANLREAFKTLPLLSKNYERATIMVDAMTLLIPEEEFHDADSDILFSHAFSGHESDVKEHYTMADLHAVALFGFDKDLLTVIHDHFTATTFIPVCAPLWEHFARQTSQSRQRLYGYFHDGKLDIFCFAKNRFKFSNSFSATHAHDTLYYLLNAFSQLGMKADRDEISLIGSTPHKLWICNNLKTYVQRVVDDEADSLDLPLLRRFPAMPIDLAIIHKSRQS